MVLGIPDRVYQVTQELSGSRSIDHTMIAGKGQSHHRSHGRFTLDCDNPVDNRSYG
jgi:hypothetical protein